MSQNNSEMNFLNKVKWLDFYGVDLQPVLVRFDWMKQDWNILDFNFYLYNKGENNIEYFIGLTPTGISVYQNRVKINSYFWPRINKLNYKSCKFMLTVIEKTVSLNHFSKVFIGIFSINWNTFLYSTLTKIEWENNSRFYT